MRITIFGATGLLGKALVRAGTGHELSGFSSKDADIRDPQKVAAVVERTRPEWIVLAAAYADVDGCETNRDLAFDVNVRGAANVARAAKQYGFRLLFLSTDYVFDGTKTTPYEIDDPRAVGSHSQGGDYDVKFASCDPVDQSLHARFFRKSILHMQFIGDPAGAL